MIADGVIKGVQIKRNGLVDRLLRRYYTCLHNADIIGIYISAMPPGVKGIVEMVSEMLNHKYPYLDNSLNARLDEIDKYNKGMQLAKKYQDLMSKK